jgi:hypothetical protein
MYTAYALKKEAVYSPKRRYLSTSPRGVSIQKPNMDITAVEFSD